MKWKPTTRVQTVVYGQQVEKAKCPKKKLSATCIRQYLSSFAKKVKQKFFASKYLRGIKYKWTYQGEAVRADLILIPSLYYSTT